MIVKINNIGNNDSNNDNINIYIMIIIVVIINNRNITTTTNNNHNNNNNTSNNNNNLYIYIPMNTSSYLFFPGGPQAAQAARQPPAGSLGPFPGGPAPWPPGSGARSQSCSS